MAEFLNQRKPDKLALGENSGFGAMGQPVPFYRQEAAYKHCKLMGLNTEDAHSAVSSMSESLSRDNPYEAVRAGMVYLDLTGTYRTMAVLLTA